MRARERSPRLVAERLAYGAGAYGHPASGTPESLPRIARDDLVAVHRAHLPARQRGADPRRRHHAGGRPRAGAAPLRQLGRARRAGAGAAGRAQPARSAARRSRSSTWPKSGQAGVVVALPLPERSGSERAIGAVAELGARRRLFVAPEPGDPHQARPQLRRGQHARRAPRGRALPRRACRPRTSRPPRSCGLVQAEIDRHDDGAGRRRRARRAQARADRRLQPQRRDDRRARDGDPRARSSRTGAPAELKERIGELEAVSAADIQRYAAAHLGAAQPSPRRRR